MRKQEVARRVAERSGSLSLAQANAVVDATLEIIQAELVAGGVIQVRGFGTFAAAGRKARTGRNPRTGESLVIAARRVVTFSAGSELKKAANSQHFGLDWLHFKDISNTVADLKGRIEARVKSPEKLGQEAKRSLESAKAAYDEAGLRLKQAADSGGKAWGELKTGLEKALSELKTAWGKAKDSF